MSDVFMKEQRATKLAQEFLAAHQSQEYMEVGIGIGKDVDQMSTALFTLASTRRNLPYFIQRTDNTVTLSVHLIDHSECLSRMAFISGWAEEIESFCINAAWCSDLFKQQLGPKLASKRKPVANWVEMMDFRRNMEDLELDHLEVDDCEFHFFTSPNLLAIRTIVGCFGVSIPLSQDLTQAPSFHTKVGPEPPNRFYWLGNYVELERKPWMVLDYLWNCPECAALEEEVREKVWGDDGTGKEKDGRIRGVQNSIRLTFEEAGFPYRIRSLNGSIALRKEFGR